MSSESFDILAARVLTGEATPQEQKELKSLLRDTPSLRVEWEALQGAWAVTQAAFPLTEAAHKNAASLPEHRLEELHTAVHAAGLRKKEGPGWFSWIAWPAGAVAVVAVLALMAGFPSVSRPAVEFGMYQEETMRGGEEANLWKNTPGIASTTFANDEFFDSWKTAPLKKGAPAKAWIDEATGELNLVFLNAAGEETHTTRSLPDDPAQRTVIIREALQPVLPSVAK